MNIGQWFGSRRFTLPLFTWLWLFGSVITAAYFAFWMFPNLFTSVANTWFQTTTSSGVVYWPNTDEYRRKYLSQLGDKQFLYISNCDVLPQSQKSNCDGTRNWSRITPTDVGCKDVETCSAIIYTLSQDKKSEIYPRLVPIEGRVVDLSDVKAMSLSDPAGWGNAGKWPAFFITLFLAVKLGRTTGEFLFTPYGK